MARIADEYYANLREQQKTNQPAIQPVATEPAVKTAIQPAPEPTQKKQFNVADTSGMQLINEEEQVKRYGGVVGSKEYYDYKAKQYQNLTKPSMSGIGIGPGVVGYDVPGLVLAGPMGSGLKRNIDDETWDKMSRVDQAKTLALGSAETAASMVVALPMEIIKVIPSMYYTAKQLVKNVKNKDPLFTAEPGKVSIPSWFKTREEALSAGYGELAADVTMATKAIGDLSIAGSLVGALRSGLRPKVKIPEEIKGKEVIETAPIKEKIVQRPKVSINEYHSIPNSEAAKFGGNASNTFLKITNAGENLREIAVVQTIKGKLPALTTYIKSKFGNPVKVYNGTSGPEIKLQSSVVKVTPSEEGPRIITKKVPEDIQEAAGEIGMEMEMSVPGSRYVTEAGEWRASQSTFPQWVPSELRSTSLFNAVTKKISNNNFKFSKNQNKLVSAMKEEMAERTGRMAGDIQDEFLWNEFYRITLNRQYKSQLKPFPARPAKGFENRLIQGDELENINTMAKLQGLEPEVVSTLSKIFTGKEVVGDLTHTEYINLIQTMGTFGEKPAILQKISRSWFGKQFSATGRHAERIEQETGIPVFSEFWNPLDDAFRYAKMEEFSWLMRKNKLYGEYNAVKYAKERDLIADYIEGNTKIITENQTLTPKIKADLIRIAEGQQALNAEYKTFYDIKSRFGKEYTPWFQEVGGGNFQVYLSDVEGWPTLGKAAPRVKRSGGVSPVIRDPSINFDNAIRWLAKEKYIKPILDRSKSLYKSVDPTTQQWMKKQVGYRLGYGTEFDRWLNNFGTTFNRWSGLNFAPDFLRKFYDDMMMTSYSSALGVPRFDAPVRDFITTNMIRYARMGNRFYAKSLKDAFEAKNIQWAREKGWLVEYGVPGGEELAIAKTGMSRARATYRSGLESTMSIYQKYDNTMRVQTALQQKDLFDEAIDLYNVGKITWDQAEKHMLLNKMLKPSQDIVRQYVFSGNKEKALDFMIKQSIDEISFPYRMGAGAPATFGAGGRAAFHLGTWNIHFMNTTGRWIRTGQWDNFFRFLAMGTVVKRSMESAFGVDVSKFTLLSRISDPTLSPILQFGTDLVQTIMASKNDNRKEVNENYEAAVSTLKALGGLPGMALATAAKTIQEGKLELHGGGVGAQRWIDFWKSVNSYEKFQKVGGVKKGMFPVFDKKGDINYYSDFADLLWQALGFTPSYYSEQKEFIKQANKQLEKYKSQGRSVAVDLLSEAVFSETKQERDEKLKQVEAIVKELNITGDLAGSVESSLKPYIMTFYESLPPTLKQSFLPWYKELISKQIKVK